MNFWRTKAGNEVDLILSKQSKPFAAIEIKAVKHVSEKMLSGLRSLGEEYKIRHQILVCEESTPRLVQNIEILPWQEFLKSRLLDIL
jgi:predicted AAA+ superfamily ATPase